MGFYWGFFAGTAFWGLIDLIIWACNKKRAKQMCKNCGERWLADKYIQEKMGESNADDS